MFEIVHPGIVFVAPGAFNS